MKTDRRSFLASVLAIPSATVAAMALVALGTAKDVHLPVLYGDGRHDDTEALQKWFDGQSVQWSNGARVGNDITNTCFRINKTLELRSGTEIRRLTNSTLVHDPAVCYVGILEA